MKNKITFILTTAILLIAGVFSSHAQTSLKGSYRPNKDLDKFEGKWSYEKNGKSYMLNLKKKKEHIPKIGNYIDYISGYHELKTNGLMKQKAKEGEPSIIQGYCEQDKNTLVFFIKDLEKDRLVRGSLTIDPLKPNEAFFDIIRPEDHSINNKKIDNYSTVLPAKVVLTKTK